MTGAERLARRLAGRPAPSEQGTTATRILRLCSATDATAPVSAALVRWLHALEAPAHVLLLTDTLGPDEILASDLDSDLRSLAGRLARAGLVRRHLLLAIDGRDTDSALSGLAESGLVFEPLDPAARAVLARRLLLTRPLAEVIATAQVLPVGSIVDGSEPTARPGQGGVIRAGDRDLSRLAIPDHLHVLPGIVEGDSAWAVLLYIDALPRELGPEALIGALLAADPVDVSIRLWPLGGDEVVRHLTRRLRDLRAAQASAGPHAGDYRVATAVDDAERLREALYLGHTRLLQAAVTVAARGGDREEALAVAARVRARLARGGFLPRVAVLRQWPALVSMLPGGPDRLGAAHNVTSQGAAALLPLRLASPEPGGLLLGSDLEDHTAVHLDRTLLSNPAAIYLGAPGSGKSSLAKMEILRRARHAPGDRFVIVDPEGEYGRVVAAAGGLDLRVDRPETIRLPLLQGLLPEAPAALRAARAATLMAPVLGAASDLARERLARAVQRLLQEGVPDLAHLPKVLASTDTRLAESAARALSGPLALLCGTEGPGLSVRALSLNLSAVDSTLLPALLPVLTEAAVGHLRPLPANDAWLWLTLDEFHLYLERDTGARLLVELAKRARKRGIVLTAVSQHLVDLVRHPDGQAILAACDTVALFRPGVDIAPFAETLRLDATAVNAAASLAPGEALLQAHGRRRHLRVELSDQETELTDTRPAPARSADAAEAAHGGAARAHRA